VQLDELPRNVQSQTEPAVVRRWNAAHEAVEDGTEVRWIDPDPVVGDAQLSALAIVGHGDLNWMSRPELDRLRQQVRYHQMEPRAVPIAAHGHRRLEPYFTIRTMQLPARALDDPTHQPWIAVVALARKLAGILYAIWRDGTTYQAGRTAAPVATTM
jgi:hypothetical protein